MTYSAAIGLIYTPHAVLITYYITTIMGLYGLVSFGLRVALLVFNVIALILTALLGDVICIVLTPVSLVLVATCLGIEIKNPSTAEAKKRILISIDSIAFLLLLASSVWTSVMVSFDFYILYILRARLAFLWISCLVGLVVIVWDILLLKGVIVDDGQPGKPWASPIETIDDKAASEEAESDLPPPEKV